MLLKKIKWTDTICLIEEIVEGKWNNCLELERGSQMWQQQHTGTW